MKLKFLNWIFIFLLLTSFVSAITTSIDPSEKNVNGNEYSYFFVKINTGVNIYAVQFELSFDDEIKILGVDNGNFLSKDGIGTYPIISYNNEQGKVDFASTRYGVKTGVSGEGNLAKVRFEGISKGKSNLVLSDVIVLDINLNKLGVNIENGIVNVLEKETSSDDSDDSDSSSGTTSSSSTQDFSEEEQDKNKEVKTLKLTRESNVILEKIKNLDFKVGLFIGLSISIILLIIYSFFKKLF